MVALESGHVLIYLGSASLISVFVSEPVKDPSGGVLLLGRSRYVIGEDLVDDPKKGPDLGLVAGISGPIAGRLGVGKDLL